MDLYEIYYINKLNPQWNVLDAFKGIPTIKINNELNFMEYSIDDFIDKYRKHSTPYRSALFKRRKRDYRIANLTNKQFYVSRGVYFNIYDYGAPRKYFYKKDDNILLLIEFIPDPYIGDKQESGTLFFTIFDGLEIKTFNSKDNPYLFSNQELIEDKKYDFFDIDRILQYGTINKNKHYFDDNIKAVFDECNGTLF